MMISWRRAGYLWLAGLALAAAGCGAAGGTQAVVHAAGATGSPAAVTAALAAPSGTPSAPGTTASATAGVLDGTPAASGMPTPAVTATATPCTETKGAFSSVAVPSAMLRYPIDTRIYLPPCYASSGKAYPVLYLIHGLNFTQDQWERLGVGTTADKLIAAGEIAPLIIVLPRDRKDVRLDPAFVTDLVPYIDMHYRTLATRAYRAIGGLSRGGGWSIHLGLRYPEMFGRVGAHSPAVFFGDENNLLQYARTDAKIKLAPVVYLDIGDNDAQRQSAAWLDQVFTWFNFPHTYKVQSGGHTESYWSAHIADYLHFYAADWLLPEATAPPLPTPTWPYE